MLIVIEGIDGSGKTTLAHSIRNKLKELGVTSEVTGELSRKDAWSVEGKKELLAARNKREEYNAVMRARLKHAAEVFDKSKPEMVFLMDRYLPSTIAYQSCPSIPIGTMYSDHACNALPVPAVVFYIKINPETAQARMKHRGHQDAIDSRGEDYFKEVHERFVSGLKVLEQGYGWT